MKLVQARQPIAIVPGVLLPLPLLDSGHAAGGGGAVGEVACSDMFAGKCGVISDLCQNRACLDVRVLRQHRCRLSRYDSNRVQIVSNRGVRLLQVG